MSEATRMVAASAEPCKPLQVAFGHQGHQCSIRTTKVNFYYQLNDKCAYREMATLNYVVREKFWKLLQTSTWYKH